MTRLLLRLFPAAWRTRYGDELLDLISDTGLTPRAVADIARAGLAERVRATRSALIGGASMTFGPAWRHPTAWAAAGAVILIPTLAFVALSMLTYQFGIGGLAIVTDPLNTWLNSQRVVDLALLLLPAAAALMAGVPLVRLGASRVDGASELSLSVRLRALNVVVVVVALAIGSLLVGHILFESVMQVGA
jgi:hypothetical protein